MKILVLDLDLTMRMQETLSSTISTTVMQVKRIHLELSRAFTDMWFNQIPFNIGTDLFSPGSLNNNAGANAPKV